MRKSDGNHPADPGPALKEPSGRVIVRPGIVPDDKQRHKQCWQRSDKSDEADRVPSPPFRRNRRSQTEHKDASHGDRADQNAFFESPERVNEETIDADQAATCNGSDEAE